jgi:hypothetical protein
MLMLDKDEIIEKSGFMVLFYVNIRVKSSFYMIYIVIGHVFYNKFAPLLLEKTCN